jgi:hypothetical protein
VLARPNRQAKPFIAQQLGLELGALRWPGGSIAPAPPAPAGVYENRTALAFELPVERVIRKGDRSGSAAGIGKSRGVHC